MNRWTNEEKEQLKTKFLQSGLNISAFAEQIEIQQEFGRSKDAIRVQLNKILNREGKSGPRSSQYKISYSISRNTKRLSKLLEQMVDEISDIAEKLEEAQADLEILEDWAQKTVNLKKILSYSVDRSGIVEDIKSDNK